jgi:GT2 family glycosyltransferase
MDASRGDESDAVDCAILIVTYNSARHVPDLLGSLPAAAADRSIRTIVVDNGSTDDTLELVRAHPDVLCIESGSNRGYAGGINIGRAKAGTARALLILNPDLHLGPGAIPRMMDALDDPSVGLVSGRLEQFDGDLVMSQRRDPTLLRELGDVVFGNRFARRPAWASEVVAEPSAYVTTQQVDWVAGAAMMISAECDAAVGDWDESFFMYSEEVDYAIRVRKAGWSVVYVPDALAIHEGAGSGRSADLDALVVLNRVRLYRMYHGRVATAVYRFVVALHETSRFWTPSRRHTAKVVMGWTAVPEFPGAAPIDRLPW